MSEEETLSAREAAVVERDAFRALTQTDAWRSVVQYISQQTAQRMRVIMTSPVTDMSKAAALEFTRGECNGLQLVKVFVEQRLEGAEEALELFRIQAQQQEGRK